MKPPKESKQPLKLPFEEAMRRILQVKKEEIHEPKQKQKQLSKNP